MIATSDCDLHTPDGTPCIASDIHEQDGLLATSSAGSDASGDKMGPFGNVPFSWHSSWPVCILAHYNTIASCSSLSGDYVARFYHNVGK